MSLVFTNFWVRVLQLFFFGAMSALAFRRFQKMRTEKDKADVEGELDFSAVLDKSPNLVWTEKDGKVTWANKKGTEVFQHSSNPGLAAFSSVVMRGLGNHRIRLHDGSGVESREFTLIKEQVAAGDLYFAGDASHLIESEKELQRFIQTLTETFAHIPIGLAIFDKERDLSLFNPALSELLNLPAEWLARRPTLMSFLDRLRNEKIMPEPRDYKSFRQELIDLEGGAVKGTYSAEWTLPSGLIYKVIGRPHLKGGMALLFEDISKAVNVERQYRTELEGLYSALDSLADGIAILDSGGELAFVNDAFDEMWGLDLSCAVSRIDAVEISRLLQKQCAPSPVWGDFRQFVGHGQDRCQWQAGVTKLDGSSINMTFSPLAGGQVICEFKIRTLAQKPASESRKATA